MSAFSKLVITMVTEDKIIESHTVPQSASRERLSEYARGMFQSLPSRKSVKKAIKRDQLLVDGQPSSTGHWVLPGEELSVLRSKVRVPVYELSLTVLYEDDFLAVIDKPGDIPVSGNRHRTVRNALPGNLQNSSAIDALTRPEPAHRLDRQTSGPLIVAKTRKVLASMGEQFKERTIKKRYRATVHGSIRGETGIGKSLDEKPCLTWIKALRQITHRKFGLITFLDVIPETGRTNQIRRHLQSIGHPILGDIRFGGKRSGHGLQLEAASISFTHPITREELTVSSPRRKNGIWI